MRIKCFIIVDKGDRDEIYFLIVDKADVDEKFVLGVLAVDKCC